MGRVEGKKAFVTGGAQGLGKASAMMLAKEGALVTLADINEKGAKSVADEINAKYPGKAFSVGLDVTREDQWKAALAFADKAMGGINVLFNNAGIGGGTTVEDTDFETWKRVLAVDADSVFLGCKYAIPYMVPHAPGSIINTSSIAGLIAGHNMAAYNAAKAAVWLLSKSVALHCAKRGYRIRSNSIHPTFIDTPILDGMARGMSKEELVRKLAKQVPLGVVGDPDDVAYAVLYLASDESKFVTGSEIKIDGGISAM
ncbi:MAG: SDR family oxidoreductase [Parvibaculum sp.]|uniref:SDR family oxidoreductase n=1 Tax=Parvibaculum sp. TaxID=2024848 RepID=UPI00284AEDDE|nr:SDR family oxidoreductase [Parvibaculum sp.]MDR3499687.1 SDR family oxidoreductase [Parvibaculum sp.]